MRAGVNVITPNKKAGSGPLDRYLRLKAMQRESYMHFFYEVRPKQLLPNSQPNATAEHENLVLVANRRNHVANACLCAAAPCCLTAPQPASSCSLLEERFACAWCHCLPVGSMMLPTSQFVR